MPFRNKENQMTALKPHPNSATLLLRRRTRIPSGSNHVHKERTTQAAESAAVRARRRTIARARRAAAAATATATGADATASGSASAGPATAASVAGPSSAASSSTAPPSTLPARPTRLYTFPRRLPRYTIPRIRDEILSGIDDDLEDIPLEFVRDKLVELRLTLQAGLQTVSSAAAPRGLQKLPETVTLDVLPFEGHSRRLPTHVLAVMDLEGKRAIMLPFHDLVLAAHCAYLPPLPKLTSGRPVEVDVPVGDGSDPTQTKTTLTAPVVPFSLPEPESFIVLYDYLLTKRPERLFTSVIPIPTGTDPRVFNVMLQTPKHFPSQEASLRAHWDAYEMPAESLKLCTELSEFLARSLRMTALLELARRVHGIWGNVVKLGIDDNQMWYTLDRAWQVILESMRLGKKYEAEQLARSQPQAQTQAQASNAVIQ